MRYFFCSSSQLVDASAIVFATDATTAEEQFCRHFDIEVDDRDGTSFENLIQEVTLPTAANPIVVFTDNHVTDLAD